MPNRILTLNHPTPGLLNPSLRTLSNPILKDTITFLSYSAETQGACTRLRVRCAPGGGTPPHYHTTYTERFITPATLPASTPLTITIDDTTHKLHSGAEATVPIDTVHSFRNDNDDETGDVEFEVQIEPGNEGFEKSLYILYGLAREGQVDAQGVPKRFSQLCLIAEMGDLSRPGWLRDVGRGVVWAGARWARWWGEERELVERFWGKGRGGAG